MRKTVLSVLNYIGCIGMALFVTFVIDGTIGMVLTYALVIALIASLVMTVAVLRSVSVQSVLNSFAVSKGDKLSFDINISNSGFLPVPLVTVEIENTAHFTIDSQNRLGCSVTGKSINTLSFRLTAKHSGKAGIRIKSIILTDYLGIFSFRLKIDEEYSDISVSIYPDIPDAAVQTSWIKTASHFSANDDDEEESGETSRVPTGLAGYDHREYVPGDPIKRINWKLSSKNDVLMVRLDEEIKGSGRTFLLDCPETQEDDISLTVRDNIIEGALVMLNSLLAEGREAVLYYFRQGFWMSVDIHSAADVYTLQEELSDFVPSRASQVLPAELLSSLKTPICLTAAISGNSGLLESVLARFPEAMIISSYAANLPLLSSNQWTLSESFDISKTSGGVL